MDCPYCFVIVNVTEATQFLTLSLHDALPILGRPTADSPRTRPPPVSPAGAQAPEAGWGAPILVPLDVRAQALVVLADRSEEHTSELQSRVELVCRLLLEKKKENRHQQMRPSL